MPVSIKNNKSNNKSNNPNIKSKKKGKGVYNSILKVTVPATYKNIRYSKHNTDYPGISLLECPICNRHVFKLHRVKIATYGKAIFLAMNLFNDSYNFFKCTDCGHTLIFSNDIAYDEIKL